MTLIRSRGCAAAAMVLAGVLHLPQPAAAQITFTVDAAHITGNAAVDDPAPDGNCNAHCTLREAVQAANAIPGVDTITFAAAGTVALGRSGEEDPNAAFNDLDVREGLLVAGHAGGTTIATQALSLGEHSRAFEVSEGATELRDLAIRGGRLTGLGGAVVVSPPGALTLTRATMTDNQARAGGAVAAFGAGLTVTDSTFSNNAAPAGGGAVLAFSSPGVTISGSTFTGNVAGITCCGVGPPSQAYGGAIAALAGETGQPPGPVRITRSTFTGNDARTGTLGGGGYGGAIIGLAVPMTISDSVLDANGSPQTEQGGAIQVGGGSARIVNSSITDNRARGFGAGVNVAERGQVSVDSSTISGNVVDGATSVGGGIFASESAGQLDIVNSTISGNSATTGGGGIHIGEQTPTIPSPPPPFDGPGCKPPAGCRRAGFAQSPLAATLHHVTVVANTGDAGIDVRSTSATLSLRSTLIAANGALSCGPMRITSLGYNIEDRSDCPLTATGDLPGNAPGIAALADNGSAPPQGANSVGVGLTHALLAGSAALDAADPGGCPIPVGVDQRGQPRPEGPGCDIGAFELGGDVPGAVTLDKSAAPGAIQPGATATFTIVVTNTSAATATDVAVSDVVPDGLGIASVAPTASCPAPAAQTVSCTLGDLAPSQQVTITVVVTGTNPGNYSNTAVVTVGGVEAARDAAPLLVATGEGCSGMGASGTGIPEGLVRVQGLNRIQTAVAASQAACGDGEAPAIVLTRADLFPDAQAGTPLAIALGAPLLLSDPAILSPETETELLRVLPPGGTVYLLGGTVALSDAVNARLQQLGYLTIRYGGVNRFETAAIIANQGLGNPATLLVANGGDFADSIVAGAAAAAVGGSGTVQATVLLTSDVNIPPETQAYLDSRTGPPPTIITIGAAAAQAFPAAESVSGASRFETSVAVAQRFFGAVTIVGLARADAFADGLTGGALVGRPILGPGPILLTATDTLPDAIRVYLEGQAGSVTRALVFGGEAAVSSTVEGQIRAALGI